MFRFGVDYYPEHWPESRWKEDARLMKAASMNIVRLAEFAWAKLEPKEGQFDFGWLDRAIATLANHDIDIILGTPTASPPPWVMGKDPTLYRVRSDGLRLQYGNRREYCPNHPLYRQLSQRIVTAMADHYAGNSSVIGWQIDNEFGDHCYCEICRGTFQNWVREKYGTLEALNDAWGTIFWSHTYTAWDQIPTSAAIGNSPNPGLALDYDRFMSESYVGFQQLQIDILRGKKPELMITHNFMGHGYEELNYYDLAKPLDIVSWDNYPIGFWLTEKGVPSAPALGHDTMRGLKGKNYWVMEQQAGPSGWETVSPSSRPGQLRLWAYQGIAHGADGIIFFRWRTARHGTEQYWHGLLNHDGSPSRRYEEIKEMGAELSRIGKEILGTTVEAEVAILNDYQSRWGFQIQPNSPGFRYAHHVHEIYAALHEQNIPVDVIAPGSDLSGYKLVIAPAMYVLPEDVAANLQNFVQQGGTLIVTPRSGVKDKHNAVVNAPLPGLLAELCGITIEDYDAISIDIPQHIEFIRDEIPNQVAVSAKYWCDILTPTTAQVVAIYTQDYYAGKPAVSLNINGNGRAIYVGTFGDKSLYSALFSWLLFDDQIAGTLITPAGIEVCERWQSKVDDENSIMFVLNNNDHAVTLPLPLDFIDLINNKPIQAGNIQIAPYDVIVLKAAQQP